MQRACVARQIQSKINISTRWRYFMIVAGIDYSLTITAICVHEGDEWNVNNCRFYYVVHREKSVVVSGQF